MRKDIADIWVKALRNPDIRQAHGCLLDENGAMCCLGVLLKATGHDIIPARLSYCKVPDYDNKQYKVLPLKAAIEFGINTTNCQPTGGLLQGVVIDGKAYEHLAEANDCGVPLSKIADWIEQNWVRL